jgi:predicted permease
MLWRLDEWVRDLRHAVRTLRRTPGFTLMAVGTLGLAIGVTAGMFAVVNRVLLTPLPYANQDRLVSVLATAPGSDMPDEFGVSAEFFVQYKEQSKLLEDVAFYNSFTSTLRVGDRVERVRMSAPSNSLFSTLGAVPILGRLPNDADNDGVVLLSHALWTSWFGADRSVLNRSIYVSGSMRTVIGVMGPDFRFPADATLLWFPSPLTPQDLATPGQFGLPLVARMAPGATPDKVAAELTTLARGLPARFGGSAAYARVIDKHRAIVRPLADDVLGAVARPLWVLLGALGIVLLIACANVANLFMVRAEGRQRDLALRRAIGAGRGQLVRVQMAEAIVVAAAAAVAAAALAYLALPAFLRAAPAGIPRLGDVRVDAATLGFTVVIAALAALACGAVPALRASSPDFARLRDGGRGATRRHHWTRDALVVAQTALALVLCIGSGLLMRSFWSLRNVDPGYSTKDIFTFQIAPAQPSLNSGPTFARFDLAFMDRLRALPGVQTVGLVENIPLDEGTGGSRFVKEGSSREVDTGTRLQATYTAGDYFKAMEIRVLEGRVFEDEDHLAPRANVIISRSAAAKMWPGESAVGKRLQRQSVSGWFTVVGVVEDVKQYNFRDAADALVYFPLASSDPDPRNGWAISSPAYVIKTPRAETIGDDVRRIVREVAPEAPMYRVYTMAFLASRSMLNLSFTMLTLGVAAALALILGAVGLYGVLSYGVAQRTKEIGVRMALGAQASQVRGLIVRQGIRVVAIGIAVGVAVAFAATRALGSLLFGVAALDVATFAGMAGAMVAVGLLSSYLPARRASNVDPLVSLRE